MSRLRATGERYERRGFAGQLAGRTLLLAIAAAVAFDASGRLPAAATTPRAVASLAEELGADDSGTLLTTTFDMIAEGRFTAAEPQLTELLALYESEQAAPEQLAILFKYRADARVALGMLEEACQDLSDALNLVDKQIDGDSVCSWPDVAGSVCVFIPSPSDLLLQRGRLSMQRGSKDALRSATADFARVIEEADGIQV